MFICLTCIIVYGLVSCIIFFFVLYIFVVLLVYYKSIMNFFSILFIFVLLFFLLNILYILLFFETYCHIFMVIVGEQKLGPLHWA